MNYHDNPAGTGGCFVAMVIRMLRGRRGGTRKRSAAIAMAMNAIGVLSLFVVLSAADGGTQRLSLEAVVERVLGQSPAVVQARERVREADAGLAAVRLSSLPRLSAKSTATRGDDPVYAFSSLLEQRRFGMQNFAIDALNRPGYLTNVKSSLELGLPVFTGFDMTDRRELGRLSVASAQAGEEASLQAARYRAAETYLRLVLDRTLLANAEARIAAAEGEIEEAKRLKARGLVLGSDFYAAQAVLEGLRAGKIRVQSEVAATRTTLGILIGSPGAVVEPIGTLEDAGYLTGPLTGLMNDALRQRQDLQQAAVAESAAAVLARRETMSLLPTIEAFAALETDTSDFGANPTNRMIGVRAALPIGDPTYFERKKHAAASARMARAGRESAEQGALIELARSHAEHDAALAALPVLRESVGEAERSLELFRPLYREGRQSILDVLRAEEALMKARAAYLETLFAAHAGYARLRLAAGRLDETAIREIDRRLGVGR